MFPLACGAGNPQLSVRAEYPYFMRMNMDVKSAGVAWVALLEKMGVKRVALIKEPGEAAAVALFEYLFNTVLPKSSISIAFSGELLSKATAIAIAQEIKSNDVRYILFPAFELAGQHLLCALYKSGQRIGLPYNVLFTFGFWNADNFWTIKNDKYNPTDCTPDEIWQAGVSIIGTESYNLGSDVNLETMSKRKPSATVQEYTKRCASSGLKPNIYGYFVYDAILLWARSLDKFFVSGGNSVSAQPTWRNVKGHREDMYKRLRSKAYNFYGVTGFVSFLFDENYNPDRIGGTRIVWQMQRKRNAGKVVPGNTVVWKEFARFTTEIIFNKDTQICWDLNCTNSYTPMVKAGGELSFEKAQRPLDQSPVCQTRYYLINPDKCAMCPAGYTNYNPKASFCVPECLMGQELLTNKCSPCKLGQMGIRAPDGSVICSDCPPGYAQPKRGQIACEACNAGRYQANKAAGSCKVCKPGTTTSNVGQSYCVRCAEGRFRSGIGNGTDCERCKIGSYSNREGAIQCDSCPGNQLVTGFPGAVSEDECVCPKDSYRDATVRTKCSACKEGMTCALGSDMKQYQVPRRLAKDQGLQGVSSRIYPLLKPRHWSDPKDPLNVFSCKNTYKCPGGEPGSCGDRSYDISCARCEDGFYSTTEDCVECSDFDRGSMPALPMLLLPIILCILYRGGRTMPDKWGASRAQASHMACMLLNTYQTISLAKQTNIIMPPKTASTWKVFAMTQDIISVMNLQCAGVVSFESNFILRALGPIGILVVAILTFIGSHAVAKCTRKLVAMDRDLLSSIYFNLIFVFFLGIANCSLSLFQCSPNPNGKDTLMIDETVVCHEDEWKSMLVGAVIACLVYCAGFLTLLSYVVYIAPRSFKKVTFQKRWRFLFNKYRLDRYWWGPLYLCKGVFLNAAPILTSAAIFQLYFITLVCAAYLLLVVVFFPWRGTVASYLDCGLHLIAICTITSLAWFSERRDDLVDDVSTFCVVLSSFPFLLFVIAIIALTYPALRQTIGTDVGDEESKSVKAIKAAIQTLAALTEDDLKTMLDKTAENECASLMQVSSFVAVELSGQAASKLSTQSLLSYGQKAAVGSSSVGAGAKALPDLEECNI